MWVLRPAREVSTHIPGSKYDSRHGNANACNNSATGPRTPRVGKRVVCLLLSADGAFNQLIAEATGLAPNTLTRIRDRWNKRGMAAVKDAPRSGGPPKVTPAYRRAFKETLRRGLPNGQSFRSGGSQLLQVADLALCGWPISAWPSLLVRLAHPDVLGHLGEDGCGGLPVVRPLLDCLQQPQVCVELLLYFNFHFQSTFLQMFEHE